MRILQALKKVCEKLAGRLVSSPRNMCFSHTHPKSLYANSLHQFHRVSLLSLSLIKFAGFFFQISKQYSLININWKKCMAFMDFEENTGRKFTT